MKSATPQRSRHTVTVRRWNQIAKSGLWLAAGLTLTVLTLIVGYILVNGFYTRSLKQEPVASIAEDAVTVGGGYPDVEFSVLVHRSLRLRDLAYDDLRDIYSGENRYWGFLTGQDRDVRAAVWTGDPRFEEALADYLVLESAALPDPIVGVSTVEALRAHLDESTGAVAVAPTEIARDVDDARVLPIRQYSVAINENVTELVDGRRLRSIDETQIPELVSGGIDDWSEVSQNARTRGEGGGVRITMIRLSEEASAAYRSAQKAFAKDSPRDGIRSTPSVQAAAEILRETKGGFALVRRPETIRLDIPVIDIRFVRHSANLRPSFLWKSPSRAGEVGGISTIILNTLAVIVFVVLIATPIGVAAAIYLVEYAKQGRLLIMLRIGTDTLAGVPSIIFGLFGLVFFSQALGFQTGLLAGSLTLTLMILPTIVRTAEEAFLSVPSSHREGSLALGATKMQTIFRVVFPSAVPGILTGVILGIGRAVGETAAVLFTMGSNLALLSSLNSPLRVLSVHLYLLVRETISIPNAFATATILVLLVLIINTTARRLINHVNSGAGTL